MDARLAPLAAILDLNTDLLLNCAGDLTDAEANQRLAGGGNSIAFLAAHLTDARHYVASLLGAPLPNPLAAALANARGIEEVEALPALSEILTAWRGVSQHLQQVFEALTSDELDRSAKQRFPIPGGTALAAVTFLTEHDCYHLGQVAFLRRQLGRPAMSYTRPPAGGPASPSSM